jgi:hypothetical protein
VTDHYLLAEPLDPGPVGRGMCELTQGWQPANKKIQPGVEKKIQPEVESFKRQASSSKP